MFYNLSTLLSLFDYCKQWYICLSIENPQILLDKSRSLKFVTDTHMADEIASAYVSSVDQTKDLQKLGS